MDKVALVALMDAAPWRTAKDQSHAYVMNFRHRALYEIMGEVIAEEGYEVTFKGYPYRCWDHGGYRYWLVGNNKSASINRTLNDPPLERV